MSEEATAANKSFVTPFNLVAGAIILIGGVLTIMRFTGGLGLLPTFRITTRGGFGSGLTCSAELRWPPADTPRLLPVTCSG